MNLLPVALANGDVIIGIIIAIFWILAQLANRKAGKNAPPQTPSAPGDPTNPQDEIRKFFEQLEKGLSGDQTPETAEPPPPPSQPAERPTTMPRPPEARPVFPPPRVPAPAVVQVSRPARTVLAEPQPSPAELELQRKQILLALEREAALRAVRHISAGTGPATRCGALGEQLRNPSSLRQMILASEILSKPVGLRLQPPLI